MILLAACGQDRSGEPRPSTDQGAASSPAAPSEDAPSIGHVGPIAYGFDPQRLTRAEIQLDLPPDYDTTVWATKLILVERAERLGEESCHYGASGRTQACTAQQEDGLALALLERPIADYRRSFVNAEIPEGDLTPEQLAGTSGFAFTAAAEGAGVNYSFFPVGERTLLVARRFSDGERPIDPAIGDVLETLRIPSDSS